MKPLVDCKKCLEKHGNNPSNTPCRTPERCPEGSEEKIIE
jgi:hypothetical protein